MRSASKNAFYVFLALFLVILIHYFFSTSNTQIETKLLHKGGDIGWKGDDQFKVSMRKAFRGMNIQILIVVEEIEKAEADYSVALNSIRCYSKLHSYHFELVSARQFPECAQTDFMFRRHCIVARFLPKSDWLLFLDADIAVVNPSILIEQFIDEHFDLTLYDRFVNWEIAAGSYLIRNSTWSVDFLNKFANYEQFLPDSFHGTDNGALHMLIQQTVHPNLNNSAKICREIWEHSTDFDTLYTFEACIRAVIGENREFPKIRILRKGTAWVRDIWLTDSEWSPQRDFMVHGLKESNRVRFSQSILLNLIFSRFNWRSPFTKKINLDKCTSTRPQKWPYDESLIVSSRRVENHLSAKYTQVERRKWQYLARVSTYF